MINRRDRRERGEKLKTLRSPLAYHPRWGLRLKMGVDGKMKRAVSISLGSSKRDKSVTIKLKEQEILVERIGTDGDIAKTRQMYLDLDGKVDAFGVGGVDLYLRLDQREYPLHSALKLVDGVTQTPLCDGRGLKHTLERRVFELAGSQLGEVRFQQGFDALALSLAELG